MKDYYALFQGEVMTKNFLRSFQCNFNQTWYKTNERYYKNSKNTRINDNSCLLYTSDAADDMQCVDLGGRRIIKKFFFFKQKTAYEM